MRALMRILGLLTLLVVAGTTWLGHPRQAEASTQVGPWPWPPIMLCDPIPCPDPGPWPFPWPWPDPWPDPWPHPEPWPNPEMVAPLGTTVGDYHNAALDSFYQSEPPIEVRNDGRIALSEYERVLSSTLRYALENLDGAVPTDQYLNEYLPVLDVMGLVVYDGDQPLLIIDEPQVFEHQVAYLHDRNAISPVLADELTFIHTMAMSSNDGQDVLDYVTNVFVNQPWEERDVAKVALFVDVYTHSFDYWAGVEPGSQAAACRPPPWVTAGADALGAVGGAVAGEMLGGVVGAVIGAITVGSAFSAITLTWTTAS